MPDKETILTATRFVDLVRKYEKWDYIKELPVEEMQVLFAIVAAAGFEPKEIKLGKLEGHYCDQGGYTGERYPINNLCLFKVVNQEDEDHYFATGWLDNMFQRVLLGMKQKEDHEQRLIEAIAWGIEQSVPLAPIQLTVLCDMLREGSPRFVSGYFVEHTKDDGILSSCVGVHKYCDGLMDRRRATELHDAIVCRSCYLRVLFPKEVKTYGDLRRYLNAYRRQ